MMLNKLQVTALSNLIYKLFFMFGDFGWSPTQSYSSIWSYTNLPVRYLNFKNSKISSDIYCYGIYKDAWVTKITQKCNKPVKNFCLEETSYDTIVRTVTVTCMHKKPKAIYILFPEIFVTEQFHGLRKILFYLPFINTNNIKFLKNLSHTFNYQTPSTEKETIDYFAPNINTATLFFNAVKNFKHIELFCQLNNISLFWDTTSQLFKNLPNDVKHNLFNVNETRLL